MPNEIDVKKLKGLSSAEVLESRQKYGPNELPEGKRRSIFQTAFDVIKEPMFLLLVACGAIYLVLGDRQEAMMLLGFVFVVMGITIYQEQKTEKALDALRDLSSPRALVIRDGSQLRIAGKDVVLGDFVLLSEGDRVPADGIVIWCNNLSADESLLTGESLHVTKSFAADYQKADVGAPGGDYTPYVFSGTLIVRGQGIYVVKAVGASTELGKIGKALETLQPEQTSLNRQTGRLVKNLALLGLALFVVIVVVYGLTRGDWVHGLLAGITLAMAMLPEEFPVVLTIFMALGAWRLSKKNVLTRRMPAIETLGAATVLCVDKTGTLTQNRMSVERLYAEGSFFAPNGCPDPGIPASTDGKEPGKGTIQGRIPERFHEVVEYGLLASERDPFDPMEKALTSFGRSCLIKTEHLHDDWKLVEEYALSSQLLALSHVWVSPDGNGGSYVVAAKGAPEAILDLCHMEAEGAEPIMRSVTEMAADGLRVLGVARAVSKVKKGLPDSQHDFEFSFIGLIGLADPVKPSVPSAITECYKAGIRVVMITGDYPGTAQNIARQIGLTPSDMVITGPELSVMGEEELKQKVKVCSIYARMVPEQKLKLVEALKAHGEVVAMTGDGVNDAPALKAANIGIAMGARGTDVAREAASLVLLDDDFSSIVAAVRQGRRVFDNLKKAMAYIFAVHIPIAGLSLIPVLFKLPLVLMPVHIAFLELIIDPSCSVVFEMEQEEPGIMDKPPRDPAKPLFGSDLIRIGVMQGLTVLLAVLAVFLISTLVLKKPEADTRALTFTALVFSNLGLIAVNRSWTTGGFTSFRRRNPAFRWVLIGSLSFLVLALYLPALNLLFHFDALHAVDLLIAAGVSMLGTLWFEAFKASGKKKSK